MALKLITPAAAEPVSLAEAKLQLRVDVSDDDVLITGLITAAREAVETITRRALVTQTWELVLDEFPGGSQVEMPLPPLQSITSIKYKVAAGTESTFASSSYVVDTDSAPGRVVLDDGASWPGDDLYEASAVRIRFVAGYGATGAAAPQSIRQAMLLMIGHWYESREQVVEGTPREIPMGAEWLLQT